MTKPVNFSGRVNARRIAALGRAQAQLTSGNKRVGDGSLERLTDADRIRLNREADALALRIKPEHIARAVRTKKTKANGWSAERAYRRSGNIGR